MQPIGSFILKCTSFCNLNCSYCYMFNLGDSTYQNRPRIMPPDVLEAAAREIINYAIEHELAAVNVTFHGGEPLLAGRPWFDEAIRAFERSSRGRVDVHYSLQTNGVLVDDAWAAYFTQNRFVVALSMDGLPAVHDHFRVDHAGRGSYSKVIRGLRCLQKQQETPVLCVIDPTQPGLDVYEHLRSLDVRWFDFLLPLEFNWGNPPSELWSQSEAPFADFLIPIFDRWWEIDDPSIRIRIFYDIIKLLLGCRRHVDSIGGDPVNLAVIESDGSIEPLDALRSCANGLTQLNLNILRHPISRLHGQPLFQTAMAGQDGLSETCRGCAYRSVCGGGYLPNRFHPDTGFNNPSIYCRDLARLIGHIADAMIERSGIESIDADVVKC